MKQQQKEIELTDTIPEYMKRVEAIHQKAYEAGYQAGVTDTTHLFKFGQTDFEPKAVNHVCESCADEFFGTADDARRAGWDLGIGCEWCASCGG